MHEFGATDTELKLSWLYNQAWVQDLLQIKLAGHCSGNVMNTTRELIIAGHEPAVLDSIRTEACRYVRGEIF